MHEAEIGNGKHMDRIDEVYLRITKQLADLHVSLSSLNEKYAHLREDVKELTVKTDVHHDQLLRISTSSNIWWKMIWPNIGWLMAAAATVMEIRHHLGA